MLETIGVWRYALAKSRRHLEQEELRDYHEVIDTLFSGSRMAPLPGSKLDLPPNPVSVLTAIQKLDKAEPGTLRAYDALSEVAHPNSESLFAVTDWKIAEDADIEVHGRRYTEHLFARVLDGVRLDVAQGCLVLRDELRPLIDRLDA